MNNKIKIIPITFLFLLNSCSVSLLNMNKDIDKLNIKIVRDVLKVEEDSIKIYISRYVNEKKSNDSVLCKSDYKIEPGNGTFSINLFKRDESRDEMILEDGYPIAIQ